MPDLFSLSGSKMVFKGKNRCISQNHDGQLLLKFMGEGAELDSYNFAYLFRLLKMARIPTFFQEQVGTCEHKIASAHLLPVSCRVYDRVNSSLAERFGLTPGAEIESALVGWNFCSPKLSNPEVSESHLLAFQLLAEKEMKTISAKSLRIFDYLKGFFVARGYLLGSLTLRFGKEDWGGLVVAEEIEPQHLELWDAGTFQPIHQTAAKMRDCLNLGKV